METQRLSPSEIGGRVIWPSVRFLAHRWKTLGTSALIGAMLGTAAHLARTRVYTSRGVYVLVASQQSTPSSLGALGGLASRFGLGGLGSSSGFDLYTLAEVARSDGALERVIEEMDRRGAADSALGRDWVAMARRAADRSLIRSEDLRRSLGKITDLAVDTRSGTFTVSATGRSPQIAHTLALVYVTVLDSLTTDLLSAQARLIREEAERQAKQAEIDLNAAEQRLEQFLARNRQITGPALQFQAQALEREATLRSNLYSQLAGRLAEARLEERRSTPALMPISPSIRPARPEGPSGRALIVLGVFFGGAAAAVATIWSARSRSQQA